MIRIIVRSNPCIISRPSWSWRRGSPRSCRCTFCRCPRLPRDMGFWVAALPITLRRGFYCRRTYRYDVTTNIWVWLTIIIWSDVFAQVKLWICHLINSSNVYVVSIRLCNVHKDIRWLNAYSFDQAYSYVSYSNIERNSYCMWKIITILWVI